MDNTAARALRPLLGPRSNYYLDRFEKIEDLEAALEQLRAIAADLNGGAPVKKGET